MATCINNTDAGSVAAVRYFTKCIHLQDAELKVAAQGKETGSCILMVSRLPSKFSGNTEKQGDGYQEDVA